MTGAARGRPTMNARPSNDRTRLREDQPLLHEEGACLPLRSRHGQCRACAAACPAGVLQVGVEAVTLADGCIGCGLCTAVCPTQALSLPELERIDDAGAQPAPALRIECRKVPATKHRGNTLVVPCLGSVTAGHLLARQAAGQAVHLVDRGWCRGCGVCGSERHPAQAAHDAALLWLDAVGEAGRPQFVHEPLPVEQMPAAIPPAPEAGPRVDRRSFFRDALQRPAGRQRAATPMGGSGRAAYPPATRHPSPERTRQLRALSTLAESHERELPSELFAALQVDASCCDRRLCVALCPTASLTVVDDGVRAQLQFDAERCIACGTCVRACPEAAMQLDAHGGTRGVHVLATHARARCPDCGDTFTPTADADGQADTRCPTCAKSRRFIDDARRQLFGALR